MNFKRLDLNLLVALDALLHERNVTRAAEKLHLTQSTMSGALARLRDYFGDELLQASGRRMVLTPLATTLAAPVRDVLLRIDATIARRPDFDPATAERRFRIAASDYMVTVLLAPAMREAARIAPGIAFDFQTVDAGVSEALTRGEVDMVVMPAHYLPPEHPSETLFVDHYSCVFWMGNTRIGDRLDLDEYLALGHVITRIRNTPVSMFDQQLMERGGHVRRIELAVESFALLPQLVVGTDRVATVQDRLARHYARMLPLRVLPAPFDGPQLEEAMQWHRYQDGDPGMQWLRGLLREAARRTAA
ncbi:LysR family transcriptional regulator [Derxia gummosa]|uniref:LysR family transcriptional regulator n=1 Tax=Derxia gummosa DSM 723 TaxID=1121388 RepID=A0A8B6X4K1_9BURK|nr:LysR family transcriptional regulator [Derxia gummosa]